MLPILFAIVTHLPVTNTADEGPGSLRQALLDARESCASSPCTIDFHIPPPAVIRPATPLPEVWGQVKIDGGAETVEINGAALREGHGLVLRTACNVSVENLAIRDFPRHAIEIQDAGAVGCPFGVFYPVIANNRLTGNERGIVQSAGTWIDIHDNEITHNRRAGIFLGTGFRATITNNRITDNGASGVFLNLGDAGRSTSAGANVSNNVIANNGEWGLCRTPNGAIALANNSIYGNVSAGIDIGLDNETPNRKNDTDGTPNKPVLFSATYDPESGSTTIRGRLESSAIFGSSFRIDVYASSSLSLWGYPQGEEAVATQPLSRGFSELEVVVPRDLRGKFITATNTRSHSVGWADFSMPSDTSEFSNAIQVR